MKSYPRNVKKRRYKVLPVPNFIHYYFSMEEPIASLKEDGYYIKNERIRELPDGWYYDRQYNVSLFQYNGYCIWYNDYRKDVESFLFELKSYDAKILTKEEKDSILTVMKFVDRKTRDKLWELILWSETKLLAKNIKRNSRLFRMRETT